jgi:hypothetical protein
VPARWHLSKQILLGEEYSTPLRANKILGPLVYVGSARTDSLGSITIVSELKTGSLATPQQKVTEQQH